MEPINYLQQVVDPFEQSLQGFKIGAGMADLEAKRVQAEQQQRQAQVALEEQSRFFAKPKPTMRDAARYASLLSPEQSKAFLPFMEGISKEQQQNVLKENSEILALLQLNPVTGIKRLNDYATAQRNGGDEEEAQLYERLAEAAADPKKGPAMAFKSLVTVTSRIPGAKEMFESIDKATTTAQGEAEAPAKLRQELAKASEAETKALVALGTSKDDIAKAEALREYEEAKARNEEVKAKYAVKEAEDAILKRLADLGLTKAQTDKYNVETRNLDTTGKLLKLDFEAALKGLPLPSKNAGTTVGSATEDERKAAGWLSQANNAYTNMLNAMYTSKGGRTGAERPNIFEAMGAGKVSQSAERQKFNQAAGSLSEALLRAATGAGVNESEAKQKIEELTPTLFDEKENIQQKLAAIPMYLESLQARAGRAAPPGYKIPTAPASPSSVSGPVKPAKNITVEY
jgi:hypothetical protein